MVIGEQPGAMHAMQATGQLCMFLFLESICVKPLRLLVVGRIQVEQSIPRQLLDSSDKGDPIQPDQVNPVGKGLDLPDPADQLWFVQTGGKGVFAGLPQTADRTAAQNTGDIGTVEKEGGGSLFDPAAEGIRLPEERLPEGMDTWILVIDMNASDQSVHQGTETRT